MTDIDPFALRRAFGSFMSGVTVVTTRTAQGTPLGFTANSFSSVSMDPPMLLVCPSRSMSSFQAFEACEHFAVNILAEGQEHVSNTFASFKGDRFAEVDWQRDQHNCPLLTGTAANFSCRTVRVVPAGDHVVLLGEIDRFAQSDLRGLGFAAGQYFSLGLERDAHDIPSIKGQSFGGVIIEHEGQVLLNDHGTGLCPPQLRLDNSARIRVTLAEWLQDKGLGLTLGNTYSIFDNVQSGDHFTYFRATASDANDHGLGRYYPITQLPNIEFVSSAHASMFKRFALEHQTQSFGLYLGDESEGKLLNYNERS